MTEASIRNTSLVITNGTIPKLTLGSQINVITNIGEVSNNV